MVNGFYIRFVESNNKGVVQIRNVHDVGPGIVPIILLIELIIEIAIAVIDSYISLVRVTGLLIGQRGNQRNIFLVFCIDNGNAPVPIETNDHFSSIVIRIRSGVNNWVNIMRVRTIIRTNQNWIQWLCQIKDVETA